MGPSGIPRRQIAHSLRATVGWTSLSIGVFSFEGVVPTGTDKNSLDIKTNEAKGKTHVAGKPTNQLAKTVRLVGTTR